MNRPARVCAGTHGRHTFRYPIHRTDIILGTELGVTSMAIDNKHGSTLRLWRQYVHISC